MFVHGRSMRAARGTSASGEPVEGAGARRFFPGTGRVTDLAGCLARPAYELQLRRLREECQRLVSAAKGGAEQPPETTLLPTAASKSRAR